MNEYYQDQVHTRSVRVGQELLRLLAQAQSEQRALAVRRSPLHRQPEELAQGQGRWRQSQAERLVQESTRGQVSSECREHAFVFSSSSLLVN